MTEVVLNRPRAEARKIIKASIHDADGLNLQYATDDKIRGKTRTRLGSFGEYVTVDIPQSQSDNGTRIYVSARKRVRINITANEQKYKRRFMQSLNQFREENIVKVEGYNQAAKKHAQNGSVLVVILKFILALLILFLLFASVVIIAA